MGTTSNTISTSSPPLSSTPSIIVHQDNSSFPTIITLDDTKYPLWSQLMEMRIGARNKADYLISDNPKPLQTDPGYATWVTENYKVRSWLIDSMSPNLMQRFIRLPTAKEIWEAVAKTFYDGSDETRLFELNQKCFTITQNNRPLSIYYNELVEIFQEIDHRTGSTDASVEGIVHMHSMMTRLPVHIFLNGLDSEFDQVRGEILRKDPKLDLESTYAYVRREAQQRQTMGAARPLTKSSAFAVHRSMPENNPSKGKNHRSSNRTNTFTCTHCGESGHSKQRCYELTGYPEWWDFSKKPRKAIAAKSTPAPLQIDSSDDKPVSIGDVIMTCGC